MFSLPSLSLFNPWAILALVVLLAGAGATGVYQGVQYEKGQEARTEVLIQKAGEAAQTAAADVISKLQPKYTTIQQKTETITREVPVYRDCHNTPDELRLLNDALSNSDSPEPAGTGELPKVDTTH